MQLAAPTGRRLADGPPSAIEDLDRQSFIAGAPGEARSFHDRFGSLFRGAGIATQDVTFISPGHTVQGGTGPHAQLSSAGPRHRTRSSELVVTRNGMQPGNQGF